ncbi:MAG: metallophosphoesterase [Actinobacteria bacterium]|nr:metallophosphoesterase [Actinomycetota bacterium]
MRIAYTSDLHVDISQRNWELVPYLAKVLKIIDPDVFVIAGDVSPELGDLEYVLDCFSGLQCPRLFIPGNQDIWVLSEEMQEKGHDSYEKYYFYLPDACRRNGFTPLWMEPMVLGGVGFVGSIAWYDHAGPGADSAALPRESHYLLDSVWNDMRWACWSDISMMMEGRLWPARRPDAEVAREFNLRLDQDIEAFCRDPLISEVVVVTHYPPFEALSVAGVPFPGSRDLAGILFSHERVTVSISGHIHDKKDLVVRNVRAVRCPVGYLKWDQRKYQDVVKDCLEVIHLIDREDFLPKGQP